jgi:nitroreductase/NAD-dependent dihydropyrimidine dehydrogenase PreA subunit
MLALHVDQELCIQCGECVRDCPYAVLELSGDVPVLVAGREERCIRCQHCLAVCGTGALSILGKDPAFSIPLAGNLPTAAQMETLIKGRRSVRWYAPEPLEPAIISHLLEVVAHGPTGVNNRQLLFTVIEDQETMRSLRQETMAGIRRAVQEKTLPSGLEFFEAILGAWDSGRDIIFRDAPHLLAVSSPRGGPSPEQDTMIALSYFELLACCAGLGTLWDGLAKWALTAIVPDMTKKLGIPETHALGYMMLFGKPAVQYHRTVQRGEPRVNRVQW